MAPWTHTYLSPQTERRLCCASREPAQSFEQYIDTESGTGVYNPQSLDEHWNSDHMMSVRRRMMAGETLPECDVCNSKLLNTNVYRSYFAQLFSHKYDDVWAKTEDTGYTSMKPISWDYRFSNLCNFKCRMCGDMLRFSLVFVGVSFVGFLFRRFLLSARCFHRFIDPVGRANSAHPRHNRRGAKR